MPFGMWTAIIRPHHSTKYLLHMYMWPIVTDGVAWSVGLSAVCHDREHCKNRRTNQHSVGLRWAQGTMY